MATVERLKQAGKIPNSCLSLSRPKQQTLVHGSPWVPPSLPDWEALGFICLFLTSPKAAHPPQQLMPMFMVTLFHESCRETEQDKVVFKCMPYRRLVLFPIWRPSQADQKAQCQLAHPCHSSLGVGRVSWANGMQRTKMAVSQIWEHSFSQAAENWSLATGCWPGLYPSRPLKYQSHQVFFFCSQSPKTTPYFHLLYSALDDTLTLNWPCLLSTAPFDQK